MGEDILKDDKKNLFFSICSFYENLKIMSQDYSQKFIDLNPDKSFWYK